MKHILGAIALLAVSVCALQGQNDSSVNGVITDPSGALLPAAKVTITNVGTGAPRDTVSDSQGRYSFAQLAPGNYRLEVKAAGFSEVVITDIHVLVNTPATVDVKVESVGPTSQTVSVSSEVVQVNTSDATLGNAIGTKPIMELPFEARNVVGLLSIQPGVTFIGTPESNDYRSGAVNGGKSDQGNVTLDGVDVNDQQYRSAFTSVLRVTLDSVQEFRTTTTNGGADSGRTSGAQVALITKSGTNNLHGSLYEYTRNTLTAANTFFNNEDGVPRQKLIRNVFGGAIGGPIIKNKLFYFANYEGRRDASEASVERVVPNATLRQGIFTYLTDGGSLVQLSPSQVAAEIDPAHLGPSPAVLKIMQGYPMPNDNTQGDGLNTAGYRFNYSAPLTYNTYISKIDYQPDAAGKHTLFIRGNLQNDDFVPSDGSGAPQFPGQANAVRHLENSKGLAVGHNWVISPALVNSLRYGYTRQGYDNTGLETAPIVTLRDIDNPIANSKGLSAIIPVHDIEDTATWTKGSHTIQFGGSLRFIHTNRLNFGNSFSDAIANSSWFYDQGSGLLTPDASLSNFTAYTRIATDLLGVVTEGDAQYNYDKSGGLLPQGQGIKRSFVDNEYEMFIQDSWRVRKNLTITAGLRVSLFPPLYEANGYQTSANVPLGDWFNDRGYLAETGQSQALAPILKFNLAGAPGGTSLYPFQHHYSPRFAFAWSPSSDTEGGRWLLGEPGKTSIRGGFGMFYDLFGQSLIRLADATALGFSTQLTNPANADYLTSPRYISPIDIPSGLLLPAPAGGFPQTAPNVFAIAQGLDSALSSPYSMNITFTYSRDLGKGLLLQGSYVGRLSRKSLQADDVAAPTNLIDPKSKQSYFQAATIMQTYLRAHPNATPSDVAGLAAIPFFEDLFAGYAGGGFTATQNLYQNYWIYGLNNDTGPLAFIDDQPSNGCSPCSVLGPNSMFNSQYSSLAVWRTRGSGSYHAMQWTLRKQFSVVQFDFNYTWSKSEDLGSVRESDSVVSGQIINPWNTSQMKAVSDYDSTQQISSFIVADLPFGRGRKWGSNLNPVVNAVLGGWGVSGIWRMSSGLPISVTDGGQWSTNWNLSGYAIPIGPISSSNTKNSTSGGPNLFADPAAAYAMFEPNFPGTTGGRNVLRGYGLFNVDVALEKSFIMPWNEHHLLKFRAEAFNVTNSVQFDVNTLNLDIGDQANFGKYTGTLGNPRVMEFGARYEF